MNTPQTADQLLESAKKIADSLQFEVICGAIQRYTNRSKRSFHENKKDYVNAKLRLHRYKRYMDNDYYGMANEDHYVLLAEELAEIKRKDSMLASLRLDVPDEISWNLSRFMDWKSRFEEENDRSATHEESLAYIGESAIDLNVDESSRAKMEIEEYNKRMWADQM